MWTVKLLTNFGLMFNRFQTVDELSWYMHSIYDDANICIFRTFLRFSLEAN